MGELLHGRDDGRDPGHALHGLFQGPRGASSRRNSTSASRRIAAISSPGRLVVAGLGQPGGQGLEAGQGLAEAGKARGQEMQVVADVLGRGVDLVGDAGGELAYGFEFLGHSQLAFQGLARAGVEDDLEKPQLSPAHGRDHGLDHRHGAAVRTGQAHVLVDEIALGQDAHRDFAPLAIAPVDDVAELADEFLPGAAAQFLGHGVDVLDDPGLGIDDEDGGLNAGQDTAQHLLFVAQVLFHLLAVGDVRGHADDAPGAGPPRRRTGPG